MTFSAFPTIGRRSALPGLQGLLARSATLHAIADQALVSGLGLLTGLVSARLLGIEQFGRFAVVMIVASLAQSVHNALIVAPVMSLAGTRRGRSRAFFASSAMATLWTSLPLALAVMGLLAALECAEAKPLSLDLVTSAGALTVGQNLLFTARRLLFAAGRGRDAVAVDAVRAAALGVLLGVALAFHLVVGLETVDWALAATAALPAAVALAPFLRPVLAGPRTASRRRVAPRALLKRCWPIGKWMLPTVGVTFGQEQVVWLLAGAMLGDAAVGGLRGAQYVVSLAYPFLAALENVAPAQASRAFESGGIAGLRRYILRLLLVYSPLACGFPLVAALSADYCLRLFFGPAFQSYDACLRVFALVVLFVFVRDVLGYFFRTLQKTRVTFHAFLVSSAVTALAMVPLVAQGGVLGAAVAIAAGQGLSMGFLVVVALGTLSASR